METSIIHFPFTSLLQFLTFPQEFLELKLSFAVPLALSLPVQSPVDDSNSSYD